jgi:maltooligosyltrehalose trehalohydrolase
MSGTTPVGAVAHELHTGAFTLEGTFNAAIRKLDHLVALGGYRDRGHANR